MPIMARQWTWCKWEECSENFNLNLSKLLPVSHVEASRWWIHERGWGFEEFSHGERLQCDTSNSQVLNPRSGWVVTICITMYYSQAPWFQIVLGLLQNAERPGFLTSAQNDQKCRFKLSPLTPNCCDLLLDKMPSLLVSVCFFQNVRVGNENTLCVVIPFQCLVGFFSVWIGTKRVRVSCPNPCPCASLVLLFTQILQCQFVAILNSGKTWGVPVKHLTLFRMSTLCHHCRHDSLTYGNNTDIFKKINAILDNSLDLSGLHIQPEQQRSKISSIPKAGLSLPSNYRSGFPNL